MQLVMLLGNHKALRPEDFPISETLEKFWLYLWLLQSSKKTMETFFLNTK